jgi:hypothetical protein
VLAFRASQPPREVLLAKRGHRLSRLTFPSENHHRAGHTGRLRETTLADMGCCRMGSAYGIARRLESVGGADPVGERQQHRPWDRKTGSRNQHRTAFSLPHVSLHVGWLVHRSTSGGLHNILYGVVPGVSANRYRFADLDASDKLNNKRLTMRGRFFER